MNADNKLSRDDVTRYHTVISDAQVRILFSGY